MNKNATKRQKLAQFLWAGLEGTSLTGEEEEFLTDTPPGGIILFTRNFESAEQLWKLTNDLQQIACANGTNAPFFIGVDFEGGRVARFKKDFTTWPAMKNLGENGSTALAFEFAKALGDELKAAGVNLNFAPCTDTLLNKDNDVIGDRSFSSDPEVVGKMSSSVIRGLKKANLLTCTKHFPGHGYSSVDSHEDLPVDERNLSEIHEIEAFKKALRTKPNFLMPGHLMFPNVDSEFPVTLSEKWIKNILLDDMNCRALLVTDDLEMGAITKFDFNMVVKRIYNLGFHQLLFCHSHEKTKKALDILESDCELDDARLNQILDLKDRSALLGPDSFNGDIIGHEEHKKIAEQFS